MSSFCGWCGRIAIIDLARRTITIRQPGTSLYNRFIGGRGLAGYYLSPFIQRPWYDPEMPLLVFTGPLTGTIAPTPGRCTIMSRSPLTGTVGDSSVGGGLGTELKKAGFDGLIITGKSSSLAGIRIQADDVRIVDAQDMAQLPTSQVCDRLKGFGSVAAVGPAAENGVLFSNIIVDRHFAAGRSGLGLVMAAKRIKYLSVKGGESTRIRVKDRAGLKKGREEILRLMAASPALFGKYGIAENGTGALYDLMDARNMMPTNNFSKTRFAHASQMNAHAYQVQYQPKKHGCRGCHVQCKKITSSGEALPEFETMSHFSALIGNPDRSVAVAANRLCNEMGMDTISAGATLACYLEITGRTLAPERVVPLLQAVAEGTGEGAALGKGSVRLAREAGRPEAAIAVKGQELSAYDPRGAMGMALSFAVATRGACHLRAYPISHEILRKPVATDRFSWLGKARIVKISEDMNAVVDSLTSCKFTFFAATLEEYALVYTAVTGHDVTGQDLLYIGERIYYQERIMNARNGFSRKDDRLPRRFFEETGDDSTGRSVRPIDEAVFQQALSDYYTVRGLSQDGMPLVEKARKLGLDM